MEQSDTDASTSNTSPTIVPEEPEQAMPTIATGELERDMPPDTAEFEQIERCCL